MQWIIHVVGPLLRENALSSETTEEKLEQLANAYRYCMQESSRLQCKYIAFSLLSCGVFRGNVDLEVCITIGLQGIIAFLQHDSKKGYPTTICFVAYTVDEQDALKRAIQKVDLSPLVQKTDGT